MRDEEEKFEKPIPLTIDTEEIDIEDEDYIRISGSELKEVEESPNIEIVRQRIGEAEPRQTASTPEAESGKLLVRKIKEGTVIDHIPAGKGLEVIKILSVDLKQDEAAVVLINVRSAKMGRKDIIKIENRQLTEWEVNKIALIAPTASMNIIHNWRVVEKQKVRLPNMLIGVVKCPNANCITNTDEYLKDKFTVESRNPLKVRCYYCERLFRREEIA